MLFWWVVPGDVVEIMIYDGSSVLGGIAYHSLKVTLRGGDEVGEVEQESPREVFPSHYAIFCKPS